ncbi:DMT family transporter [Neomoorella humiferrea]|uniref:EamA-like transporter family protein n=1 Tax=Neomoorella humiferrea TaxID=676965 RepID=A0A2T0AKB4_9FIRM|nr:DMT family transporter [Moorella humiferrea]PRR69009.1 EamA-like transporter family protein [Moorella humiferrea]
MAMCPETERAIPNCKQHKNSLRLGYVAVSIATFLYGGNVIAGRLLAPNVPPAALSTLRGILGLIILLPFARRATLRPRLNDFPVFMLIGLLSVTIAYVTFAWSMQNNRAISAAVIISTSPAVTLLLLALGWHEKPNIFQIAGVVIAFAGLTLVSCEGSLKRVMALQFHKSDLILLINVIAVSLANILVQKETHRYPAITTCTWSLFFGTIFLLPPGLWEIIRYGWHLTWWEWLLLFYMGGIIAGVALLLNFEAVNRLGSGTVAMFNNLTPLVTVILAALLLNEKLLWYHTLGMILALGGVFLSLRRRLREENSL